MAVRAFVSRFSPNRTDPALLEAIFVQRHKLADVWLQRLKDSILTDVKHHLLAVGPRGCGKSHLVALLLGRLRKDPTVVERVRIAWLPEDETTPSFWKFLLRILRALNAEYGNEFAPPAREELANATDERRSAVLTDYLLKRLNGRTLLVVVENLDDVMRGLKDEGQKRWRAFLQEHPVAVTLATSQQLTEEISDRERPFFNFFQIEHLAPLSADEALSLLQKIAEHKDDKPLASFLQTPTGRARVRAIKHIAGGSHRIFIILSEFATREKLDDLVAAFEELLDELTPYYQERLRWLPDQQREIVEFLCRQTQTVSVKEIAGTLFLTEQTAAAQLKQLKDKGYVTAGTIGRESRYELAEAMMRLCVEVKDSQRELILLIVQFLRVWYDATELESRLRSLSVHASHERQYFQAALDADSKEYSSPLQEALFCDLEKARASGDRDEIERVLLEHDATATSVKTCFFAALAYADLGRFDEEVSLLERAIKLDPTAPHVPAFWEHIGFAQWLLSRYTDALAAYDRAIELAPNYVDAWVSRGSVLTKLKRPAEAIVAFKHALAFNPKIPLTWIKCGRARLAVDQIDEAMDDFRQALQVAGSYGCNEAMEGLAEAFVLQEKWQDAERLVSDLFGPPDLAVFPTLSRLFSVLQTTD